MVLHASLPGNLPPQREQELLAQLPYGRRLELEARAPMARNASLAGLWLVLAGVLEITGREARASELRFPPGGKPHFAGAGPKFSVSHCERCVVAAISADIDPGIDVEDVPARFAARAKLARWVATEAILKASGAGLRAAKEVSLDEDAAGGVLRGLRYQLYCLELGPGVIGSLASLVPVGRIEYRATPID
jgi:phosphopantetheinyl transferase